MIFNELCFLLKGGAVMFYQKSIEDILKESDSSLEGLNEIQVKNILKNMVKMNLLKKRKIPLL